MSIIKEKLIKTIKVVVTGGVSALLLAGGALANDYGGLRAVQIGGGPTGGAWYASAAQWSVLVQERTGLPTSVIPGGGVKNAREIQTGRLHAGVVFTWGAEDAANGAGVYEVPHDKLRHVATLYPVAWQAAVPRSSDIHSISDLNGKRVSFGNRGESGIELAEAILDAYDMSFEGIAQGGGQIIYVGMGQAVDLMQNRQLDLTAQLTSMPQGAYLNLNNNPGIRLLSIDDEELKRLNEAHPKYANLTVPAGTYEGIDYDVQTVGALSSFVASEDLSDDLVYEMTAVLWEDWKRMQQANSALKSRTMEQALQDARVPLHPGAERYYREQGLID